MRDLTNVYDFLRILSIIKDFWSERENSKSILQVYYTKLGESLGREIELINDLETIFPISDTKIAQEQIIENEKNLLKSIVDNFFPLDKEINIENEIRFWKINVLSKS